MTKSTGLASFARKKPAAEAAVAVEPAAPIAKAEPGSRTRGKGEIVALSFRLTTRQWERLKELSIAERASIQQLVARGLDETFFAGRGLEKL
jgi:hypothetical protein